MEREDIELSGGILQDSILRETENQVLTNQPALAEDDDDPYLVRKKLRSKETQVERRPTWEGSVILSGFGGMKFVLTQIDDLF